MNPFLGEIRIFAGSYAPLDWALCNGQLLPVSQYSALFSILGTRFGGNGTTNFGLPNMQGAFPLSYGRNPVSQVNYELGQAGGQATVTLDLGQMGMHNHVLLGTGLPGTQGSPENAVTAQPHVARTSKKMYAGDAGSKPQMSSTLLAPVGNNMPHNNLPPYVVMTYIICLKGIFPPRP
jgi:microcystin-dependent protein